MKKEKIKLIMKKIKEILIESMNDINTLMFLVLFFMVLAIIAGGMFGMLTLGPVASRVVGILGFITMIFIWGIYIKNEV